MAAYPAGLTPEQQQLLDDADRWNAFADVYNARALAAGILDPARLAAWNQQSAAARTERLRRWGVRP